MIRVLLTLALALPLVTQAAALRAPESAPDARPEAGARAGAEVSICYNYGCVREDTVQFHDATLVRLGERLASARTAAEERERLAEAIGRLYRVAGTQTPVGADRAGNFLDAEAHGRMDCIDHSTSTTRLLGLLADRGYLRWHRVLEPQVRSLASVLFVHWSAVIEEWPGAEETAGEAGPARFAVDSWFVDNGYPAVILPLEEWKKGAGPDV